MGIGGLPLSIFYKFPLLKAIATTTIGGCLGAYSSVYLSDFVIRMYHKYFPSKIGKETKPKRKFTWTNKMMVKLKRSYGLVGVASITPLFLSYPFGCFIAVRYFKNKKKITTYMLIATVFWSVTLSVFKSFFH